MDKKRKDALREKNLEKLRRNLYETQENVKRLKAENNDLTDKKRETQLKTRRLDRLEQERKVFVKDIANLWTRIEDKEKAMDEQVRELMKERYLRRLQDVAAQRVVAKFEIVIADNKRLGDELIALSKDKEKIKEIRVAGRQFEIDYITTKVVMDAIKKAHLHTDQNKPPSEQSAEMSASSTRTED